MALFVCGGSSAAQALLPPPCGGLANPVYFTGTATGRGILQSLGTRLVKQARPVTYVFQATDSCTAMGAILSDLDPTQSCVSPGCIRGAADYFTTDATSGLPVTKQCELDDANGTHVDVALSDLFPSTCAPAGNLQALLDVDGPAHAAVFVTPKGTAAQRHAFPEAISAEEAFFTFGFSDAGIKPWDAPLLHFIRDVSSEEQQVLASLIGLTPDQVLGVNEDGGKGDAGLLAAITLRVGAPLTGLVQEIGIVSDSFYDRHRGSELSALAFQAFGQYFAYFPDSSAASSDKQNVRDGHYVPWTYLHALARISPAGTATTTDARNFAGFLSGASALAGYDVLNGALDSGLIPRCAMTVARQKDGADLEAYSDAAPCGCFYRLRMSGGSVPADCAQCADNSGCSSGVCNHGFCEAH